MTAVLCIDPGSRNTGYAVVIDGAVERIGCIRPKESHGPRKMDDDHGRVTFITGRLVDLVVKHGIRTTVIEPMFGGKSAQAVKAMAIAWATATATASALGLEVVRVSRGQALKAIGLKARGTSKAESMARIRELHPGIDDDLEADRFEHAADAVALWHGAVALGLVDGPTRKAMPFGAGKSVQPGLALWSEDR